METTLTTAFTPAEFKGKIVFLEPIKKSAWSSFARYNKTNYTVAPARSARGYHVELSEDEKTYLLDALNLPPKSLDPNSDYWRDFSVKIPDHGTVLRLDIPLEYLQYKVLLQAKSVSSKYEDKPSAEWRLRDREAEAKVDNTKFSAKRKAFILSDKMSIEECLDILKMVGRNAGSMGPDLIQNSVSVLIEEDPNLFMSLYNDPMKKVKVTVADAIAHNIITKRSDIWWFGDHQMGHTKDDVASYLSNPKNQELLIAVRSRIELKTK